MIEFRGKMVIGVEEIDNQHRELIDRINRLLSMGMEEKNKEEIQKMLDFLQMYVIQHFDDEEQLQVMVGYPKHEAHRKQHEEFVKAFVEIYNEYRKSGPSQVFKLKLDRAVVSWIVNHVQESDSDIGRHIRDNNITL
jgi:hemerythrin